MCCKKISKKKLRSPFLILLVFAFFLILRLISPAEVLAQDSAEEPSAVEDPAPEDLIRSSITLDVETSTYYELQNWLFRLNLETSGTKQELASRLLRYYEAELGGLPPAVPEGTEGPDGKKSDSGTPERMEVQSAGRLEYLKDGEGDQLIRIDGGVVLQMKDSTSGTVHTVDAQRILFNRKNSSVTAEGDVFYRMGTDEKAQEFQGEKISFNIENYRGVFVQGASQRPRTIEGKAVVFYFIGDTIYRIRRDTVRLERGIISSSRMENPYYSIKAGNVWILGINEWALRDAVLYIGHIPVFYIPFFYRPGDTFVLHPSVGMRSLEGYYTQTSTYFLGKKKEDADSAGAFSFLQAVNDGEGELSQERKGLFLHKTREKVPETWVDKTGSFGKYQLDYYSRLGLLTGVNLSLSELGNFKRIELLAGMGFTNYIYTLPGYSGTFTPFRYDAVDESYVVNPQEPYVLGIKMPFRFGFDFELEYKIKNFNFELGFPFHTDLLLRDQLTKRNEELGWTRMLTGEGIQEMDSFENFENPRFYQHTGIQLGFLEKLPFINSFRFSKLDSRIVFSQSELPRDQNAQNKLGYYYPELVTPLDMELSVRGTLLDSSRNTQKKTTEEPEPQTADEPGVLTEHMRPPAGTDDSGMAYTGQWEEKPPGIRDPFRKPDPIGDIDLPKQEVPLPFSHTLNYTFSPDLSYHTRVDTDSMSEENPEAVGFVPLYTYVFTDGNASFLYNAKMFGGRFTFSQTARLQGRYRDHFDGDDLEDLLEQDRSLSYFTVLGITEMKHFFLRNNPTLAKSYLLYSIEGDVLDYSYNQEDGVFDTRLLSLDEEGINRQKSELVLIDEIWGADQKLQISYTMPPLQQSVDTSLTLQTGPLRSTAALAADEEEDGGWYIGPIRITELLKFGENGYFEQNISLLQPEGTDNSSTTKFKATVLPDLVDLYGSFEWNLSRKRPQNGVASITVGWWTNRFEQRYMQEYDFAGSSWSTTGQESFQPYLFTSSLVIPYDPDPMWKNRIRFQTSLSATLQYNLIRYNESYFQLSWNTTFKIEEFIDLRFSIKSANNVMYRYVEDFSEELGKEPLNLFDDLRDSFRFSDRNARLRSNFNLQSFSFSFVHYMHDWQLNMQYSGAPELDENNNYEWQSEFSIFVQWEPIPEIKKNIDYNDGEFQF